MQVGLCSLSPDTNTQVKDCKSLLAKPSGLPLAYLTYVSLLKFYTIALYRSLYFPHHEQILNSSIYETEAHISTFTIFILIFSAPSKLHEVNMKELSIDHKEIQLGLPLNSGWTVTHCPSQTWCGDAWTKLKDVTRRSHWQRKRYGLLDDSEILWHDRVTRLVKLGVKLHRIAKILHTANRNKSNQIKSNVNEKNSSGTHILWQSCYISQNSMFSCPEVIWRGEANIWHSILKEKDLLGGLC